VGLSGGAVDFLERMRTVGVIGLRPFGFPLVAVDADPRKARLLVDLRSVTGDLTDPNFVRL